MRQTVTTEEEQKQNINLNHHKTHTFTHTHASKFSSQQLSYKIEKTMCRAPHLMWRVHPTEENSYAFPSSYLQTNKQKCFPSSFREEKKL